MEEYHNLPLPGEIPDIREVSGSNGSTKGITVQKKKLRNHIGIFLIRLGFPQLEFNKIRNKQGIDNHDRIPQRNKERIKVNMVTCG
jgi:hypothetical protein